MIDLPHILAEVLVAAILLITTFLVWLTREVFSLKAWKTKKEVEEDDFHKVVKKIDKINEWMVATKASLEPDTELRKQLPLAMNASERQANELQSLRETLLLFKKEIDVKLDGIADKVNTLETNCLMHKMISAGKSDILAQFIRNELSKS